LDEIVIVLNPTVHIVSRLQILLDKPQLRLIRLVFAGTLIAGLLEMVGLSAIPVFVRLLLEPGSILSVISFAPMSEWIGRKDQGILVLYGASLLAAFFLLKNLYIATLFYTETRLAAGVAATVSKRLFRGYVHSPYTFHLQRNPADLVRILTEECFRSVDFLKAGIRLLRDGMVLGVVFFFLFFFDLLITLIVFTLLCAASGVCYLLARRSLSMRGRLSLEHWGRQVQVINQTLGTIKDIKLLGHESHVKMVLGQEVDSLQSHECFYLFFGALPKLFLEVLAVGTLLLVA